MTTINAAVAIATNASAVLELLDMFEEFATDIVLEVEGAFIPYKNGTEFKLARANNEAYGEALTKALDENRDALNKNDAAAKALSDKLMIQIIADTILKGWNNVKYKGAVLPYSVENAKLLLAHSDFRAWVKRQSENREWYKAKLVEEAAKN